MSLLNYLLSKKYTDSHNSSTSSHTDLRSNSGKIFDTNTEVMLNVWKGTQSEYDDITVKDENTLYLVFADPEV